MRTGNYVKFILKGTVATIIFVIVFLSNVIQNLAYTAVLAAMAAAIAYFADSVFDFIEEKKRNINKEETIKAYVKEILSFLKNSFSIDIQEADEIQKITGEEFDLTKDEVFRRVIQDVEGEHDKEILLILALTKEIDNEKNISIQSQYRSTITDALRSFDTIKFDSRTETLMEEYIKLNKINSQDYKKVFIEFAQKYSTLETLSTQIFDDLTLANEFRKTLSTLLIQGKLNLPLVKGEIKKRIDSVLKTKQVPGGFIVLMNKFQTLDEVQGSLDKFPYIKVGRLTPHNFPSNTKYLSMRIVYPKTYYASPKDFLEKEILNKIPKEKRTDGFVAVLPLEITEIYSYPKTETEIEKDIMKQSFQAINYLMTGQNRGVEEVLTEYALSHIKLSEILSVIPFNIFVPELKKQAKELIIENYATIQSKFRVKSLFDWAEVNQKDLRAVLASLDKQTLLKKSEWEEVAKQICEQAKKHAAAIG
jgi:hypothetical protein